MSLRPLLDTCELPKVMTDMRTPAEQPKLKYFASILPRPNDELGDSVTGVKPTYRPTNNWAQGSTCAGCFLTPNKVVNVSRAFDGTWHDSTYTPETPGNSDNTIDASFMGTAVYVYFIIPNFVQFTTTLVNVSFSIDGTSYGQYQHIPHTTSTILYNTLVFHTTNLANTDHTIEIRASGSNASLILFDNMVYTVDEADPSSSSLGSTFTIVPPTSNSPHDPSPSNAATEAAREFRSSPPIGAIAGGVAGGVAILSLLFVLYCYLRKRATKRARQPAISVHTAMAYVFNSPNATLERPSTHPDAQSSHEMDIGSLAAWSTMASYSIAPILPQSSSRPIVPGSKGPDSHEPEVRPTEAPPQDPLPSSDAHAGGSPRRDRALQVIVALLQEELERSRLERQLVASFGEIPPRYEERRRISGS
ncbi:hypothetical protein VTO73DRAFT_238 [Trametes versicolor]